MTPTDARFRVVPPDSTSSKEAGHPQHAHRCTARHVEQNSALTNTNTSLFPLFVPLQAIRIYHFLQLLFFPLPVHSMSCNPLKTYTIYIPLYIYIYPTINYAQSLKSPPSPNKSMPLYAMTLLSLKGDGIFCCLIFLWWVSYQGQWSQLLLR